MCQILVVPVLYVPHSLDSNRGGEDQGLAVDQGRLRRAEDLAQHLLRIRTLRGGLRFMCNRF